MIKIFLTNIFLTFCFYCNISAQNYTAFPFPGKGGIHHSGTLNRDAGGVSPQSSGQSGTGANINVVYHRINWTIDPNSASKTITGTVVTYFKTLSANVSAISFDLNKTSFNNGSLAVNYHGTGCTISFPGSGNVNILNITLPSTITSAGTLDSVSVTYSGIPPAVSGAAEGYQSGGGGTNKYVMTLSESYEDRDWWPCKADMQDKIDSMDINVTVPWVVATSDTFWVATNGRLIDSTITGNNRTFKFKTRYPIASYLVCVSVAKFTRYYRVVNIGGTNVQVAYYLLRNTASQPTITAAMDKINLVLSAFSAKFGDYPFKLEKHGFYDGLLGAGGMEHQTFSGIANGALTDPVTLSHELMHQWFGDNVTFATWNDLWLAEGFARYSEALAAELVPSLGYTAYSALSTYKSSALGLTTASAWIPNANIGNSDLIWGSSYGSTVYERGCMVVSMLRAICGDTKFFEALTNYQTDLKGSSANTDSLKNYFNAILGIDISEFFKDYVGGSGNGAVATGGIGNPVNNINWNAPQTNKLVVQMGTQTRTGGSNVSYFNGPVVLHATNAATGWTKDTTIVFYDWGGGNLSYAGNGLSAPVPGNLLTYTLSFTPTHLFYDDSARTLSTGSTTKVGTLAAGFTGIRAYAQNTRINVEWSVASPADLLQFDIERSEDGIHFTGIGTLQPGVANGNAATYNWPDRTPLAGDNFYRVRNTGTSGDHKYSSVVKARMEKGSPAISIYPNPVGRGQVNMLFSGMEKGQYLVRLVESSGKTVLTKSITYNGNNPAGTISTKNIGAGTYFLEIIAPGLKKTMRELTILAD